FKEFVKKTVNKSEARPFKAADGTIMMVVDPNTGQKAKFNSFLSNFWNFFLFLKMLRILKLSLHFVNVISKKVKLILFFIA
ncbi:hypothetical protein IDH05_00545, partial [Pelagibacterales bacterium SAG-MED27]|nr:hypothetical protein [Pelagibacterales bacterium SAG-MED27]